MMRRFTASAAFAVVALIVLSACGGSSSSSKKSSANGSAPVSLTGSVTDKGTKDASASSSVEIEADDFYFNPTFIKAKPGQTVTVALKNEGKQPHTFTIDGMVDQMLNPSQTMNVQVTAPQSGALNFYCRFHRGRGMQGAIYTSAGSSVTGPTTTGAGSGSGY